MFLNLYFPHFFFSIFIKSSAYLILSLISDSFLQILNNLSFFFNLIGIDLKSNFISFMFLDPDWNHFYNFLLVLPEFWRIQHIPGFIALHCWVEFISNFSFRMLFTVKFVILLHRTVSLLFRFQQRIIFDFLFILRILLISIIVFRDSL